MTHLATASGKRGRRVTAVAFTACLGALATMPVATSAGPLPSLPPLVTPAPAAPSLSPPAVPQPGAVTPPDSPVVPPGPASNPVAQQPSGPAASCSFPPLGPGEVRVVDAEPSDPSWWWGQALAVDPGNPCQMYMTQSAATGAYPYAVMGAVAEGGTANWHLAFKVPYEPEDSAGSQFGFGLYTPQPIFAKPGVALLAETSAGLGGLGETQAAWGPAGPPAITRVFRSDAFGSQWSESDQGLLVQSLRSGYTRLVSSPGDPRTVYLVSVNDSMGTLISVSHDAGASWQVPRQVPGRPPGNGDLNPGIADDVWKAAPFAVDPLDADTLYHFDLGGSSDSLAPILWESRDAGVSWTPHPSSAPFGTGLTTFSQTNTLSNAVFVSQFFATRAAGANPDLYAHVEFNPSAQTGRWFRSQDLGATWVPLPLPTDTVLCPAGTPGRQNGSLDRCADPAFYAGALLIADRTNPNLLVWVNELSSADGSLQVLATTDGFNGAALLSRRLTGPGFARSESLQEDQAGDFFLSVGFMAPAGITESVIAFRPGALSSNGGNLSLHVPPPTATPPPTYPVPCTSGTSSTAPSIPQPALIPNAPDSCNLPVRSESVRSTCLTPSAVGGSVTFDGRYVDFAQGTAAPGVIFRFAAMSCSNASALVLRASDFASGMLPSFSALTYDALYRWPSGEQGAILGVALPGSDPTLAITRAPIYAINPQSGSAHLFTSVDMHSGYCGFATGAAAWNWEKSASIEKACPVISDFSFDIFRHGIWTVGQRPEDPDQEPSPGFLDLASGDFTPNPCVSNGMDNAGFTVAGDGVMYVQAEDDQTLYRQNFDTCALVDGFGYAHPNQGENPWEDEEIACDPVSGTTPVIWERNTTAGSLVAFPGPNAYCPFPTRLTEDPLSKAAASAGSPLCFTLEAPLAGLWQTLQGQVVSVTESGREIGRPVTDAAGRACVQNAAAGVVGSVPFTARFSGTLAYLPSQVDGVIVGANLSVLNPLAGLVLTPPGAGTTGPASASQLQPSTATQSEAQSQAQAQAEAQAQAQTQAQSQAQAQAQSQPGVAVQRERRTQVALQKQESGGQVQYEASALPRSRPGPVAAIIAGLMVLGFGTLVRRPQWAVRRAAAPGSRPPRR